MGYLLLGTALLHTQGLACYFCYTGLCMMDSSFERCPKSDVVREWGNMSEERRQSKGWKFMNLN